MCHESKLTNSVGRTKLSNSLRKQQLELFTRTWSGHAPWNGSKFVCQLAWCQKAIEVGQRFSLEKAFIIQEKEFIIATTYQINSGESLNILYLQAFNLRQKWVAHVHQFALWSLSPGRKMVVSFTTKYAVSCQIKSNPEFSSEAL